MIDNRLEKLRFWCQKVLPTIYDDSLSYYELLNKVVEHLNTTVEAVDDAIDEINSFETSVNSSIEEFENSVNASIDEFEEEVNTSVASAISTANQASTVAQEALQNSEDAIEATEDTMAAIDYLAENLNIGYKRLSENDGYLTHAEPFRPLGKSGMVIVNGCLILDLTNAALKPEQTLAANRYHKVADFNTSINDFVPAQFYVKGFGFINEIRVEIVASKGQDTSYFEDGIWVRGFQAITSGSSANSQNFIVMPMVVPTIGSAFGS